MWKNIPRRWIGVIGQLNLDPCTARVSGSGTHWLGGCMDNKVADKYD